jgi:hypothetical protein
MKRWLILCIIFPLLIAGCSSLKEESKSKPPDMKKTAQKITIHQNTTAETAKKIAQQHPRVDEAAVVAVNDELSVGLKVSNVNRLFLKSIRKDVFSDLRKRFPKHDIHVTTDSKIFKELQQVASSIQKNPTIDKTKVHQKLQKINDDMKG